MTKTNPQVDEHFDSLDQWQAELKELRALVLDSPLTEEWKWRQPCYTFAGGNIVILSGFKEYCSLNFFKGSLMQDPDNLLVAPSENTQASRQIRFTCVDEIAAMADVLTAYIHDAIEVEKSGLKVAYKPKSDYDVPEELLTKFEEDPAFMEAFETLTPGRQKGYLLHFSGAKQSKTRTARIENRA